MAANPVAQGYWPTPNTAAIGGSLAGFD